MKYFTKAPPTFQEFSHLGDVINIKQVDGLPVFGDGVHDDTANINIILNTNTGKVIYFPAGFYTVSNTIAIPPDSRVIGDAYASYFSATGPLFSNPASPIPLVQLGQRNDVGVGQIVDMMFTVAEILPGCKLVSQECSVHSVRL